nr:isoform 2 of protein eds1 [Quercus suber]
MAMGLDHSRHNISIVYRAPQRVVDTQVFYNSLQLSGGAKVKMMWEVIEQMVVKGFIASDLYVTIEPAIVKEEEGPQLVHEGEHLSNDGGTSENEDDHKLGDDATHIDVTRDDFEELLDTMGEHEDVDHIEEVMQVEVSSWTPKEQPMKGMVISTKLVVRHVLTWYVVRENFSFKTEFSDSERLMVSCEDDSYPWMLDSAFLAYVLERYIREDPAYKIKNLRHLALADLKHEVFTIRCHRPFLMVSLGPIAGIGAKGSDREEANTVYRKLHRREKWARYFIHFVMRYDIVTRILFASVSSILLEFQRVLQFLNEKSINLAHASINNFDASNFYMKVMKNASSVASHAACNLMGNTNLLLETVSNFIPLSPYKPFGTYLCHEEECTDVAQRTLQQHIGYESELQDSFQMLNEIYLEPLEQLPLSSDSTGSDTATINAALNDLGLSTRTRMCLCAAGELEKRKIGNKESIDLKKPDIEKAMKYLEEDYQLNCSHHDLGCYDAFKLQETSKDFDSNVKRLELAGIWDEIIEMLKMYELPNAFEGLIDWVLLGTRYHRLVEPLDIANYYRHLKNEDIGAYMIKGRPKHYRFTQRWHEHAERMPIESSGESCFWAR